MSLKDVLASVKKSFQFNKVITIGGVEYGLAVLSLDQENKVNSIVSSFEDIIEGYKVMKKEIVCEAVVSINGEKLGKVVKDTSVEGKEVEKDKAIFLRELLVDSPTEIIEQIFNAYLDLKEQSEGTLKKSLKYDWYKTPEQREKEAEEKQKEEEEKAEKAKAKEAKLETEEKEVAFKKIEEPIEPVSQV